MLRIDNLVVNYGHVKALRGISLEVKEGEVVALIGNNGAGKSTTLKTITGLVSPTEGFVYFNEQDITDRPTNKIVQEGIVMIPEGRRIFATLSVRDNLQMGAYLNDKDKAVYKENLERVYSMFPILKEREKQLGGTLSGGQQQMLAIGRGLMANPKIMLMDEPTLGLSPMNVDLVAETVIKIRESGIPVLLVEQNAMMSLSIADRGYVLETGNIIATGTGHELLDDEVIQKAYLGF